MRTKRSMAIAAVTALAVLGAGTVSQAVVPAATQVTTVKMVLWPGPEGDAMQKVVNAYNANQGRRDGVRVQMVLLSRDNTFAKQAALMKARSSEYDIYFTASYLVAQHAPYLTPLQGVNRSLYLKSSVDSLRINNQQFALPLDTSLHFLYYRKDLLRQMFTTAGTAKYRAISREVLGRELTPKRSPSTWTWDDAIAVAAFFTKKYNPESPTTYGYALPAKNLLFNTMLWNNVLWSFGGNWLRNGRAAINTTAGRNAINVYRTIYDKGLTSPNSSQWEYAETNAALSSGDAFMAMQWNAAYAELDDPERSPVTAGNLGIAPPPGNKKVTHVHALAVGINKFSRNQAAAAKWMSYLGTTAAMRLYAQNGGVPSMPSILSNNVTDNPGFAYLIEYANRYGYSRPPLRREFDIYAKLAEVLSPAWTAQKTAAEVAPAADAAITPLLR